MTRKTWASCNLTKESVCHSWKQTVSIAPFTFMVPFCIWWQNSCIYMTRIVLCMHCKWITVELICNAAFLEKELDLTVNILISLYSMYCSNGVLLYITKLSKVFVTVPAFCTREAEANSCTCQTDPIFRLSPCELQTQYWLSETSTLLVKLYSERFKFRLIQSVFSTVFIIMQVSDF